MTKDKAAPREFWLQECTSKDGNVFMCDLVNTEPENPYNDDEETYDDKFIEIHVVEYSAYAALKQRVDELEKKLAIAIEALEYYANRTDRVHGTDGGGTARMTLNQIKGAEVERK